MFNAGTLPQERSENLVWFFESFGKVDQDFITEDRVGQLLSELLWSCRPTGQNESGWHNELASVCENHPSSIRNWQNGTAKLSLVDALRLMAHLGEPFAKPLLALAGLHVGLEPSEAEQELQALRDEISRLAIAAGNGGLRAVPSGGTVK